MILPILEPIAQREARLAFIAAKTAVERAHLAYSRAPFPANDALSVAADSREWTALVMAIAALGERRAAFRALLPMRQEPPL